VDHLKRAAEIGAIAVGVPIAAFMGLVGLGIVLIAGLVFLSIPLNIAFPPDEMRIENDLDVKVQMQRCDKVGWRSQTIVIKAGDSKVAHPVLTCIAYAKGEYAGCLFFPRESRGVPTVRVSETRRDVDQNLCDKSGRHNPKEPVPSSRRQLPWLRVAGMTAGFLTAVFVLATCVGCVVLTIKSWLYQRAESR
jgi:hypothetical protein